MLVSKYGLVMGWWPSGLGLRIQFLSSVSAPFSGGDGLEREVRLSLREFTV